MLGVVSLSILFIAIVVAALWLFAPRWLLSWKLHQRRTLLRDQLVGCTQGLANSARAGQSLAQGLESVSVESEEPLAAELRRLVAERSFDVYNLHLLRDPRGVTMSLMTNSGYSAERGVRVWLKRQRDIFRISRRVPRTLQVFYEDLCLDPERTLRNIHEFSGLRMQAFTGNFKDTEHHILGNRMRLSDGSIRLDERWKRNMSAQDRSVVEMELKRFVSRNADSPLAMAVDYYLSEGYLAASGD